MFHVKVLDRKGIFSYLYGECIGSRGKPVFRAGYYNRTQVFFIPSSVSRGLKCFISRLCIVKGFPVTPRESAAITEEEERGEEKERKREEIRRDETGL